MRAVIVTAVCICITSAIVFHINGGRVKSTSIVLKQDRGSLTVRPAGVVIKPQ
jgi:hypothetical protein